MTTTRTLDLDTISLRPGHHPGPDPDAGMCVMEAVAWIAGEPWSDHPKCASRVIGAFLRAWNDRLPDTERQELKQYIGRLVGSAGTPEQETQRAWMATDWLVRTQTPTWLRLAGMNDQADLLANMGELTGSTPSLRPTLLAIRDEVYEVRAQRRAELRAKFIEAFKKAAWAAGAAEAAEAAEAAGAAEAARDEFRAKVRAAVAEKLQPTVDESRAGAHQLVDRMLAVTGN